MGGVSGCGRFTPRVSVAHTLIVVVGEGPSAWKLTKVYWRGRVMRALGASCSGPSAWKLTKVYWWGRVMRAHGASCILGSTPTAPQLHVPASTLECGAIRGSSASRLTDMGRQRAGHCKRQHTTARVVWNGGQRTRYNNLIVVINLESCGCTRCAAIFSSWGEGAVSVEAD